MKKLKPAAFVAALAAVLCAFSWAPASADTVSLSASSGSFSSYISGWAPSSAPQSRTWYDPSSGTTSIKLSGCSTNGPGGFDNVTLQLVRTSGINTSLGTTTNGCYTTTWYVASNRTGNHRFGSTRINGSVYYNGTWSANSVVVGY